MQILECQTARQIHHEEARLVPVLDASWVTRQVESSGLPAGTPSTGTPSTHSCPLLSSDRGLGARLPQPLNPVAGTSHLVRPRPLPDRVALDAIKAP